MDLEIGERRAKHRFAPPAAVDLHVTMRPGCRVVVVDVTEQGALIESPRPLRPGATIQLMVTADAARYAVTARVLRCSVAVLESSGGVTYRAGLAFDAPVRWPWALSTHDRFVRNEDSRPDPHARGNSLPVRRVLRPSATEEFAK